MKNLYTLQNKITKLMQKKTIAGLYNRIQELNASIIENENEKFIGYIYSVTNNDDDTIHIKRISELEKIAKILKMKCECIGFIDDIPLDD